MLPNAGLANTTGQSGWSIADDQKWLGRTCQDLFENIAIYGFHCVRIIVPEEGLEVSPLSHFLPLCVLASTSS